MADTRLCTISIPVFFAALLVPASSFPEPADRLDCSVVAVCGGATMFALELPSNSSAQFFTEGSTDTPQRNKARSGAERKQPAAAKRPPGGKDAAGSTGQRLKPKLAIVLTNLGPDPGTTRWVIERTPVGITLAFLPLSDDLPGWVSLAKRKGHEVLVALPLQAKRYPREKGPRSLLTDLSDDENGARLDWVLSQSPDYVGVASFVPSPFLASGRSIRPIIKSLHQRGLLYVDREETRSAVVAELAQEIGVSHVTVHVIVDADGSRDAIEHRLAELEAKAHREGAAIGLALPYRTSVNRLSDWTSGLEEKGFMLVPISAIARAGAYRN